MKKKLFIVSMIVIIIGLIIVAALGFNVDLRYRAHKSIIVPIGENYNVNDIKSIANDVFGKDKYTLEKSGLYEDEVVINVKESSDEQIQNLKNKVNEKYNISQELLISIGNDYNVDDVKVIAKEVFGKEDVNVKKAEESEQYVSIEANLLSQADLEKLNTKINEKYGLTNQTKSISSTNVIKENDIPRVRLTDMAKQYLLYTLIATVLVAIYFAVRFIKLGIQKVMVRTIATVLFAELFYAALIAIVRIPVNKIVVIAAFAIYVSILMWLNYQFIKELADNKK